MFEEGKNYCRLLEYLYIEMGEPLEVLAFIGSSDGKEIAREN